MLDLSKWYRPPRHRFAKQLNGFAKGPLKLRLEKAQRFIKIHLKKLDDISRRLQTRDRTLYRRVVGATQRHDMTRAAMLANEVVEVRKIGKMLTQSKIALEQIEMRIGTVKELGEVTTVLATANTVINNVKSEIGTVIPAAEGSFNDMNGVLNSLLVDTSGTDYMNPNVEVANDEAEIILAIANSVAEERLKGSLPEIPIALQQQWIP